jgi:tRNA (guanine10-N2)-dimethyltransferase
LKEFEVSNQMSSPRLYFFLLSGENRELAVFEFKSIIDTFGLAAVLTISSDKRIIEFKLNSTEKTSSPDTIILDILRRATMTHFCCTLILKFEFSKHLPKSYYELISNIKPNHIKNLKSDKSFSVTTRRIGEPFGIIGQKNLTKKLSSHLGTLIIDNNPGKVVNLNNPEEKFIAIINKYGFWFGKFIATSLRNEVRKRGAHNRPFFHPSSMNPFLQRTMINLAALKPGEWLLDPFCGSGGALLEAARFGIKSIGVEIDRRIIWGANKNLKSDNFAQKLTHLIFGDAKHLSFKPGCISAVVTDPPYGTTASTKGFHIQDLLLAFFREIRSLLSSQDRLVIALPSSIDIEEQAAKILGASYEKFFQYVHRSLTRKILVFIIHKSIKK